MLAISRSAVFSSRIKASSSCVHGLSVDARPYFLRAVRESELTAIAPGMTLISGVVDLLTLICLLRIDIVPGVLDPTMPNATLQLWTVDTDTPQWCAIAVLASIRKASNRLLQTINEGREDPLRIGHIIGAS